MYRDPDLPVVPVVRIFPQKPLGLWLKALARPEADLKAQAAAAIARAHRAGMKGLESAVAPLRAALDEADAAPTVRLAVARALVTLDARTTADSLLKQASKSGGELREIVEPALARWDHRPARAVWLERLADPATTRRDLILAVKSLAAVREEGAVEPLRKIVLADKTPGAVRLEAARALGTLRTRGLEKDALRLISDESPRGLPARLAAAALLRGHRGDEAVKLLQRLAGDREATVVRLAVARLIEIDPRLVLGVLDRLLASPDPALRGQGVDVLSRLPQEKHAALLGARLDDLHPGVRGQAWQALEKFAAKKELREAVLARGTTLLEASWRGQEQAMVLLARLDHKPAAAAMLQRLSAERAEVFVTAAWGLRKLAVADTLPEVQRFVTDEHQRQLAKQRLPGRDDVAHFLVDYQLSQLNQLLGQQKYRPADDVLRRFVPKVPFPRLGEARASAIWALGLIHEDRNVPALAKALQGRLLDMSIPPEDLRVKWMAGVTLGRMKSKEVLPTLRQMYPDRKPMQNPISNACGWAIERITGEKVPAAVPIKQLWRDTFLNTLE